MATLFNTQIQDTFGKLLQIDEGGVIQTGFGDANFTSSLQLSGSIQVTGGITGSVFGTATSASYALSASFLSGEATASNALTASLAVTASHALTASSLDVLRQDITQTGSLQILGNLSVIGTASFILVTASQVLVEQNTITVFGSGSVLPSAGYIAADTSSTFGTGSLLFDFPAQYWQSNKPISASHFNGTASYAAAVPTYNFVIAAPTASWICNHNLGTDWVNVTCWDTASRRVILPDEIESVSTSSVKISFTTPIAGVARIS